MNKTSLLSCDQLLDIFSSSHIATAIYTTDDLIIEAVTDAMLAFWGKGREVVGLPLRQAIPELVGQPFIDQMRNALASGVTYKSTDTPAQLLIDGELSTFYYDYEYRPIRNADGDIYCLIHYATDVTDRVIGQQAILLERESRQKWEREQELNEELAASNEELASANEELAATNEELFQTQQQLNDLNNDLEARVAERTQDLEESESRLRYMIDDAPVAIAIFNGRDLVIEAANQYMLRIWGKNTEVIGKPLLQANPELEGQSFIPLMLDVFDTGEAFEGKEVKGLMDHHGELREIFTNFTYKPLKDENGKVYSLMVVAHEVTEQVLARRAVEAARYRLEAMVTTTPVAMTILHGRDLIIEQANAAMYQIWQRDAGMTLGKKLVDVFPELIGQPFPDLLANVFDTGKPVSFPELPVTIGLTDGTSKEIFVNFSYDPIFTKAGEVESILASVIDVTASVTARRELELSEQQLQASTEELAAANEELTAINEEMVASNEELISTQDHLHATIEMLNDSQERFSFLLNSIPQQVWTADTEGAIDYVNDIVCDDFGFEMNEIIGQGWQNFIHPDDLPKALEKWVQALNTGTEYVVEFRLRFADGVYHWHLARAKPLVENDKIQLWIGTNTNIELQKNNEQKKDEFLSIASHELKTPLTSIKAFNQLIRRGTIPDTLAGFAQKSADHIQRLEKLIADLLDVTKMNSGKLEYTMQPFSFKKMLTDSVENIQHFSGTHQIILQNAVDLEFTGDHFRLEQVLNNFLTNAVKYSPKGERVIIDSQVNDNEIIVSVQDFGIGISQSHIDKLFDRYYRVDNTSMRFEGLGLGLFISSEILKRHQGRVWIESEPDKGSTFYFSLPIVQAEHGGAQMDLSVKGIDIAVNENN
ncbi:PAS domain-containing protein [Mucilaginibacter myungsuensis]|uniref:histidine kinase n=1 Tax=Mucilaginibacter myungsuensis TaxID=649104 RepID=A0A929KW27_9SPHI|nr:PAS domain-containing protein [Mucilaginibacter myungsuensis]MBE9662664.1 PAS domain-containing protein [Mucilaginibacter myungsuensis]MDN3598084.1 PAS domain-containing protein [Mucilaginibacter myungsuensis]